MFEWKHIEWKHTTEVSVGDVIIQLRKLPIEERVTIASLLFPDGEVLEDNYGQQVIYTGVFTAKKKEEPPKPEVRWDLIYPRYRYLTIDRLEEVRLYEQKPSLGLYWDASAGGTVTYLGPLRECKAFVTVPPGLDWRESLVERPE